MKKTIFDAEAKALMLKRIAAMKPDSKALWGKMNARQAICHLADQLRFAIGEMKVAGKAGFFGRNVAKYLVLSGMPAPKGKVATMPELDQLTAGTKPVEFEQDRQALYALIDVVCAKGADFAWAVHPIFGELSRKQWGKLIWLHLQHHLSQFGV